MYIPGDPTRTKASLQLLSSPSALTAMEGPDSGRGLSSRRSSMELESPPSTSPSRTAPAGTDQNIVASNKEPMSEVDDPVDDPEAKPSTLNLQIECPSHDNAASLQNGTPSRTALFFSSLLTTTSARLYIFDVVSNILVAKQYYDFDYRGKLFDKVSVGSNARSKGSFIATVAAMVIGHIGCGIAFMTADIPKKEHPLLSAYFFPLVQLRRVVCNLWNPLSKGNRAPNDGRVEALYAIVSAAIEGGPHLIIQYSMLTKFTFHADTFAPHPFLILSLVVSAVSASYNVIRAMIFIIPIRSICLGLVTGLLTLSTLVLQCTTLACLVNAAAYGVSVMDYLIHVLLGIYVVSIVLIPFIGFYILIRPTSSQRNFRAVAKSTGKAVGFAYVSASFGPLYPLVSIAQTSSTIHLCTKRFRVRLFIFAAYQMMLELICALVLPRVKEWRSPCSSYHDRSRVMPCFLYKAFLIGGFTLEAFSVVAFALLIRGDPADGLQTVSTPNGKTLVTADGAFDVLQTTFNIVRYCWGS